MVRRPAPGPHPGSPRRHPPDAGGRAAPDDRAPGRPHDWELSWDPHGLRLTYEALTLVLGVPATLRWYLEDGPLA